MSGRLTFRRPLAQRRTPTPTTWEVWRDGRPIGTVVAFAVESNVRRGRMQADPWWQAKIGSRTVTAPSRWAGPGGVRPHVDRWQTRREAADALVATIDADVTPPTRDRVG